MQAIWPRVIERHGGEVDAKFDFSTLAHISEGYSSGTIDQVHRVTPSVCSHTVLLEQCCFKDMHDAIALRPCAI